MLFEALFFVRIKNIKYSWNLFHYLIEINYSKILILSKKRNISKVRQNLKYEIEAIRSHHNLKWVKLELYLHFKRDIFWRKNTEYKLLINQEHFTVGIFAMSKNSLQNINNCGLWQLISVCLAIIYEILLKNSSCCLVEKVFDFPSLLIRKLK